MRSLLGVILLLGLVACHNGWDKDPLTGQEENIKKAVPPGSLKPSIPPLKDVVFIDTDQFYDFKVGQERSIIFTYRVTHPDLVAIELDAPSVEDILPGANFDKSTSQLTWTPSENFVTGDQYIRRVLINLVLYVDNSGVTEEHRQLVAINVLRNNLREPEIIDVVDLPTSIKEGERSLFQVKVRDFDGTLQQKPSLLVVGTGSGQSNGSDLVSLLSMDPLQDFSDPSLWTFRLALDLNSKELTRYFRDKFFALRVISGVGIPSKAWKGKFRALTQIVRPEFFHEREVVFQKDQENHYSFSIVDPRSEGKVTAEFVTNCSGLTPSANCSCRSSGPFATCTINWKPRFFGSTSISIKAKNEINRVFVQDSQTRNGFFKIKVE